MEVLDPRYYRAMVDGNSVDITRDNIDMLLDHRCIATAMSHGKWWCIRRNGETQKWKRDPMRIRIPFKAGLRVYGAITECDFIEKKGD